MKVKRKMKVTNKKTGKSYEMTREAAQQLLKSPIGNRFRAEKELEAPPEVIEMKRRKTSDEPEQPTT